MRCTTEIMSHRIRVQRNDVTTKLDTCAYRSCLRNVKTNRSRLDFFDASTDSRQGPSVSLSERLPSAPEQKLRLFCCCRNTIRFKCIQCQSTNDKGRR